jgi:hypothetical protein
MLLGVGFSRWLDGALRTRRSPTGCARGPRAPGSATAHITGAPMWQTRKALQRPITAASRLDGERAQGVPPGGPLGDDRCSTGPTWPGWSP